MDVNFNPNLTERMEQLIASANWLYPCVDDDCKTVSAYDIYCSINARVTPETREEMYKEAVRILIELYQVDKDKARSILAGIKDLSDKHNSKAFRQGSPTR